MTEHISKTVTCDMCGAEIDIAEGHVLKNSVLVNGYNRVPVSVHNEAYDPEWQDCVELMRLDLCPECADRACGIRCDITEREDGSWDYAYSWKEK